MPRERYHEELDDLRESVLGMGELVVARFDDAATAIQEGDDSLARSVIEGDHEINERYLDLEGRCIDLFALQQPVASDLRFIAASFKIITDLERIADLATNLAGYAIETGEIPYEANLLDLARLAREMVEDALAAYADSDPAACGEVADRDDELDGLCERVGELVVRDLVERERDETDIEALLPDVNRVLLTVRDIERVGDHAVNIAARTLYSVQADDDLLY